MSELDQEDLLRRESVSNKVHFGTKRGHFRLEDVDHLLGVFSRMDLKKAEVSMLAFPSSLFE